MHCIGKKRPWLGKHPEIKYLIEQHHNVAKFLGATLRKLKHPYHRTTGERLKDSTIRTYQGDVKRHRCTLAFLKSEIQYKIGFFHEKNSNVIFLNEYRFSKKCGE